MAYINDKNLNPQGGAQKRDSFDPLLVGLHDALHAYREDCSKSEGLISHVAAILDANLSENEKILASEVLISLIKQAESDIRHSLSLRLSAREDLHEKLLHYMVYGEIDIARPVLMYSPLLKDMDLMFIIQSKGVEHWQAIAARENISERIVGALIDKKEDKTVMTLLRNNTLEIQESSLKRVSKMATESLNVAEELICYKELPQDIAVSLYWHVSIALRNQISERFEFDDTVLDSALEDCVQDFTDTILQADTMRPSGLMNEVAGLYFAQDKITEKILVDSLRRRQGRFFIALFSMKTGLKHDIVWNMMKQVGGQALAVACRALNISKESFVSLFLLSRTIARSNEAVNAEELKMAMRYYDGLTFKMAKDILRDSMSKI